MIWSSPVPFYSWVFSSSQYILNPPPYQYVKVHILLLSCCENTSAIPYSFILHNFRCQGQQSWVPPIYLVLFIILHKLQPSPIISKAYSFVRCSNSLHNLKNPFLTLNTLFDKTNFFFVLRGWWVIEIEKSRLVIK